MKDLDANALVVRRKIAHEKALQLTQAAQDRIEVYEAANQGFSPDNLIEEHYNCEEREDYKLNLLQLAINAQIAA